MWSGARLCAIEQQAEQSRDCRNRRRRPGEAGVPCCCLPASAGRHTGPALRRRPQRAGRLRLALPPRSPRRALRAWAPARARALCHQGAQPPSMPLSWNVPVVLVQQTRHVVANETGPAAKPRQLAVLLCTAVCAASRAMRVTSRFALTGSAPGPHLGLPLLLLRLGQVRLRLGPQEGRQLRSERRPLSQGLLVAPNNPMHP